MLPGAKLWLTVKGCGKDIALGIVVGVGGGACAMNGVGVGGKGGGGALKEDTHLGREALLAHLFPHLF